MGPERADISDRCRPEPRNLFRRLTAALPSQSARVQLSQMNPNYVSQVRRKVAPLQPEWKFSSGLEWPKRRSGKMPHTIIRVRAVMGLIRQPSALWRLGSRLIVPSLYKLEFGVAPSHITLVLPFPPLT